MLIDPPEGDLGTYLDSLRRLQALGIRTIYPAHGFAIANGPAKLAEYLEHRELRLTQIHQALVDGVGDIPQLVARVYTDTPAFLHAVAQRSALASLFELRRQGKAHERDGRWLASR